MAHVFSVFPSWHPHSPPLTTPAPSSSFFPVADQHAADLEYPSPPPSNASPSYSSSEHFPLLAQFPQIDSSIGPSRVLTRRQRAALEHAHMGRRASVPSNFQRSPNDLPPTSALYPDQPAADSLLDASPRDLIHDRSHHRERLSLHTAGSVPLQLQSPTYHPMTPTSMSSPSYSYHPYASAKSAPEPAPEQPRAPSPALSAVSALTSVSAASAHFRPYARPSSCALPAITPKTKQKKQRLDNHARKSICLYHDQHPNARQEDIANVFKVERSTISKILKHKTKWISMPDNLANRFAKHRPSKFPEIEDELMQWLEECSDRKICITDSAIRNKAKETARMLHISEEKFKASSGWVENFKSRHGIRGGVWTGADKPSSPQARVLIEGGSAGPSDEPSILSPLNPAFTRHAEGMDLDDPSSPRHDDRDIDSDPGSPESQHEDHHDAQPLAESPVMVAQPPWADERRSIGAAPLAPASPAQHLPRPDSPSHSPLSLVRPHLSPPRLPPLSSQHVVDLHGQRHSYLPESSAAIYYHTPHIPAPRLPTLADAEDAINTLITFLDSAGQGILEDHERQALNTVKCALFQAGSGVPFDRRRH